MRTLLQTELAKWAAAQQVAEPQAAVVPIEVPRQRPNQPVYTISPRRELVAGGEVLWKPINTEAAKLLSKSSWICQPRDMPNIPDPVRRPEAKNNPTCPLPSGTAHVKKKHHHKPNTFMSDNMTITEPSSAVGFQNPSGYVNSQGIKVIMINGEPHFDVDSVRAALIDIVSKLPKETRPAVKAAEDARAIIYELTEGLGGDMERFRADAKRYVEDIRSTRMVMVTETSHIVNALKEIRQFFLGGDYKEEISRLKEFVDLCERLQKLKESGFLDTVADTMLRLAIK